MQNSPIKLLEKEKICGYQGEEGSWGEGIGRPWSKVETCRYKKMSREAVTCSVVTSVTYRTVVKREQLTLEQCGFEPCRPTYTWIFKKYF